MGFLPSVIAAASVISAAGEGVDLPDTFDEKISRVSFVCIIGTFGGLKRNMCIILGW